MSALQHLPILGLAGVLALAPSCKSDPPVAAVSLKFEPPATNAPQGGIADFTITNVDRDHPFGVAPMFVSGAVPLRFTEVSATRIAGIALIDPMAPIGPLQLTVASQAAGGAVVNLKSGPDDGAAPIVSLARSPLRLTPGTAAPTESVFFPRLSTLYKVPVSGEDQVVFLTFATVGAALRTISGARLVGAIAPPTGKFADGVIFDTTFDNVAGSRVAAGLLRGGKGAGDAFIAVHTSDLSGAATDYEYSVKVAIAKGAPFTMKEPGNPDSPEKPLASIDITGPMVALDGAIDRAEDADYVLITPASDGRLVVSAVPVGVFAPINVSLFGNDPGTSSCQAYLAGGVGRSQVEARVVAGTTYCARINSPSRQTMPYQLVVTPEL